MNKKIFYVKVRKCSVSTYWYKNYVGVIFPVIVDPTWEGHYQVVDVLAWIEKKDAKRVKIAEVVS